MGTYIIPNKPYIYKNHQNPLKKRNILKDLDKIIPIITKNMGNIFIKIKIIKNNIIIKIKLEKIKKI